MEIGIASEADIPVIKMLAEKTWPDAYAGIISPAQIRYMLDLIYSEAALKTQMRSGHRLIFALDEDVPVGFASFSKKSSEELKTFRLHKLYVLPTLHGKGIGVFLLNHIIEESQTAGAKQLELNVNKHNPAKLFYDRKGFTVLREEVLDIGEGYVMDDFVMVKKI